MDSNTYTRTITGRPISKKNSKRIFIRAGKPMLLPSVAYEAFKNDALYQLMSGGRIPTITQPVIVHCIFHIKGKIRVDGDNLFTSMLDILQDAEILADDNLVVAGRWEKYPGYKEFETIVTIEKITI